MKPSISTLILSLLLLCAGCSESSDTTTKTEPLNPETENLSFQRKSNESVEAFLKRKYSKLNLSCSLDYESSLNSTDTIEESIEVIEVDLFSNYSEKEEIVSFELLRNDFAMTASFKYKPKFIRDLEMRIDGVKYKAKQTIQLIGEYSSAINFRGSNGNGMSTEKPGSTEWVNEKVASAFETFSIGGGESLENKISIDLSCTINSDFNRGFENQFRVIED